MKLSDGERLIVIMLAEVMEALKLNREVDPALLKTLACYGDDWAIKRKYSGIFGSEGPKQADVSETTDILWMWGIIEHSLRELAGPEAEQAQEWRWTQFSGFDGNNDAHHGIAHTMIRELGDFEEFKDRPLNSHSQTSLPRYRSMFKKFDGYVKADRASPLPFEALQDICN